MNNRFTLPLLVAGLSALSLSAQAAKFDPSKLPPVAAKTGVTFDQDIRPLFQKHCADCHGAKKQKAKMRLDSVTAALKGSEEGPVIVAGKSAESQLVYSVARVGKKKEAMPPEGKGTPLTAAEVGLIRAWIDEGAK